EELIEDGCVLRAGDRALTLTAAGVARRDAIVDRAARFEADYLAGIPKELVEAGRNFLKQLIASAEK
ncbi:MAG TPA: hypothetical protein VHL79_07860, partial [Ramlibacter sp.]|nr:hypothetical protein [Ramlibacter sp.]